MLIDEKQFEKLFIKCMKKYFPERFENKNISISHVDSEVIKLYKNNISRNLSNVEFKALENFQNNFSKEIVIKAIEIAVINNGKNLNYIKALLKDWNERGLDTCEKIDNYLENHVKRKSYGGGEFNNYTQRNYNFDDLEKKLLGWGNK